MSRRAGGSHIFKHLVWLTDVIASDEQLRPACDELIQRIVAIDWTPKARAAKFMLAAAYYVSRRPPEVARRSFDALLRWNDDPAGKIPQIVARYGGNHV